MKVMHTEASSRPSSSLDWQHVAVFSVQREQAVQCECRSERGVCGKRIYRQINLLEWQDGRIECWGRDCFKRGFGKLVKQLGIKPLFTQSGGAVLSPEERALLAGNRRALIDRFLAAREAAAALEPPAAPRSPARALTRAMPDPERPLSARVPMPPPPQPGDWVIGPPEPFEPMNDPAYVAIRDAIQREWVGRKIRVGRAPWRGDAIRNALHRYSLRDARKASEW